MVDKVFHAHFQTNKHTPPKSQSLVKSNSFFFSLDTSSLSLNYVSCFKVDCVLLCFPSVRLLLLPDFLYLSFEDIYRFTFFFFFFRIKLFTPFFTISSTLCSKNIRENHS
ncbi:hypothetical protein HMI56_002545 [Coelomomyces lativittatus]|nr:hypothetical protein HMI56_002545 [Coelomomyces lativittatus]